MAPVLRALSGVAGVRSLVCVTAQHRELLDQVLSLFSIRPDADLDLMREGQTLTEITTRALTTLEPYLARERPHLLLVQGDTTTVFAAALAASATFAVSYDKYLLALKKPFGVEIIRPAEFLRRLK